MRSYQIKVKEKIKTRILRSTSFLSENRAVYKMMWTKVVQSDIPRFTIRRKIVQRNTALKLEIKS